MNNSMIHSIIHNLVAGQFAFSWKLASIEIMSAGRWLSNSIVSYLSLTDENTNCLVWFPNPLAVRWSQMRTLSTDCLGPDFSLCTIIRSKLKGIVTFGITTRIEHTQSMALYLRTAKRTTSRICFLYISDKKRIFHFSDKIHIKRIFSKKRNKMAKFGK